MEYSNPEIPEGINTSKEHPLKDFFILLASVGILISLAVLILSLITEQLASRIPFSMEKELVNRSNFVEQDISDRVTVYLQALADELEPYMDTPEGIQYTLHHSNSKVKNAYATLGGHIYIFQGLIEELPSENALAMVVAHEMAHIKHRHPVIALGRGVVIGLFLAGLAGFSGDQLVGQIVNNTGMLTLLKFNRDQEREADHTALAAVAGYYGHVAGADDLFKSLQDIEARYGMQVPEFLSTHPLGEERIENIYELASAKGWQLTGKSIPIPADVLNCQCE
jgi:predicted Zn-dependent protease